MSNRYGWNMVRTFDGVDYVEKEEAETNFDAFMEGQEERLHDLLRAEREKAFEEAAQYVRWKKESLGKDIHPATQIAYEEAERTILTWDMQRSTVQAARKDDAKGGGEA